MQSEYPTYKYTEDDVKKQLAHIVRLDNPDTYPFNTFHAHEYNEIIVFTTGNGRHNINFKNYKIQPNSIHLLAAKDIHWLERSMDSEGFSVVYKDQFLHKLQIMNPEINFQHILKFSKVINLDEEQAQSFKFIFKEILRRTNNLLTCFKL